MTDIPVPIMVTTPHQLGPAMQCMERRFPQVHDQLVAALGEIMTGDGHMIMTTTQLAKAADVPFNTVSAYLRSARLSGALCLLGRSNETGQMRYCAYQPNAVATHQSVPEPREPAAGEMIV